ncbi:MAG TPA: inositol monophosphatase family protein [Candidatus Nitrosotalea sp.]|nr:inositol monophosphatase family protein [Candidatus Nitrosotalea sp.]
MREAVLPLAGTDAGGVRFEVGAGGDRTLELDRAAEAVVFTDLTAVAGHGETFSVLSEESGRRSFGSDYPLILVDPVDGSLNAKQGVPVFALMLAALDGPTIDDTFAGYVLNMNNGEAWTAIRKQGAWRAGAPLLVTPRQDRKRIQILGLESSPKGIAVARPLVERSNKLRILGSMALSIAHTAAGGFDVFCAPMPVRVFDMAASLLLLSEVGGVATDMRGNLIGPLAASLDSRTTLLCAPTKELHDEALEFLGPLE